MAQPERLPHGLENGRALLRFSARVMILATFAAFGSIGFNRSLAILLWMAMVFSAVSALVKREPPFPAVLNHWDEMMGYGAILALLGVFEHPLPA
jgi:hypothetical protein